MNFNYFMPTNIVFGPGKLDVLSTANLPGKKALIVTTAGKSVKKYGYLDRLEKILDARGIHHVLFDKILPNPIKLHVMEGSKLAKENGCDFVIGFGGGSSIDSAKSIAVMAKNDGDYWDYISGGSGKAMPVLGGALPIVAITTTSGTGTEADPWTVITKEETNEKIGFGTDFTFPFLSIVDPELMLTVPTKLTAFQGFDALFHSTEGYLAKIATPVSDALALKSISLIAKYLPVCVKDGNNLEARTQVALANTLSGLVETFSSCTSEHSMEHALSANHPDLPHGAGLIMLSESYYSFYAQKLPHKLIEMAKAMGAEIDENLPEEVQATAFVDKLKALMVSCDVDDLKMSNYGISLGDIPELAENAHHTMGGLFEVDPYPISLSETVEIMEKAFK